MLNCIFEFFILLSRLLGNLEKQEKHWQFFKFFWFFFSKKSEKKIWKFFILFFVAFSNVFKNLGKKLNFKILTLLPRTKQVAYMGHIYKYMNILSMSFPPVDKPQCKKKRKKWCLLLPSSFPFPLFLFLFYRKRRPKKTIG